jgi:radical SAM superfamily enzyme YgiQ (UPF0313 family)
MIKKKIYLIHPSYKDQGGTLLKGKKLYTISLALPALSSIIPQDWEKEFCFEYFEELNFDSDASVIGITSMGYEIFRAIEIATEFRKRGKLVILGGFQPHISVDFVKDYSDSIVHGNPGIADMSKILKDAEFNSLQKEYFCKTNLNYKLDYSIIDTNKIFFTPVLLSIGCYNSCDYCCVSSVYKGKYYLRKFKHVIEELEYLHQRTKNIAVVDTNFYGNYRYLRKICHEMIKRNFKFVWGAQSTIDIGDDIETLSLLEKAGCKVLFIGMESIDQNNLDDVNKKYDAASYQEKITNIHSAGIKIAAFFIYGFDHDTIDTSAELSQFIIENNIALPMLNILVPTPGTKIYEKLKKENRILMENEADFLKNNIAYNSSFNLCFYTPKNMTPEQVENGFIDILKRLSGYSQIFKRSRSKSIPLFLFLLYMNWLFRKEYLELKMRKERTKTKERNLK